MPGKGVRNQTDNSISPPICPYCQRAANLVDSAIIYGRSYGMVWDCRPCDAFVGVHKNSRRCAPKGSLANRELRGWRKRAHYAFDNLWKSGKMTRMEAYKWLQEQMSLTEATAHIGMFNIEQCRRVIQCVASAD